MIHQYATNMRIVFFGTPEFALPALEKLINTGKHTLVGVVTQPDKQKGRGNKLSPPPVKQLALQYNLPVWQPKRLRKDEETLTKLKDSQADVFVVVAYGQILPPAVLKMPRLGCINVHASLLPEYRGAAPIQWCLYDGKTETGVTTMLMDEGLDTGDILLQASISISLLTTYPELSQKLALMGADLLLETLDKWERGEITPIPQDNEKATYAPVIRNEDYLIDWHRPALQIHNQIRAFSPDCYTTFRGQTLKVSRSLPLTEDTPLPPPYQHLSSLSLPQKKVGEVVKVLKNQGFIVQTGKDWLLILEVQLAGKKLQPAASFINGMRLQAGEVLQ